MGNEKVRFCLGQLLRRKQFEDKGSVYLSVCLPCLSALEPGSRHPSRRRDQEEEKRGSKGDQPLAKSNKWKQKGKLFPPTFTEAFSELLPLSRARSICSALGAVLSSHNDSTVAGARSSHRQYLNAWAWPWSIKPYWWTWKFQFPIISHITKYFFHFDFFFQPFNNVKTWCLSGWLGCTWLLILTLVRISGLWDPAPCHVPCTVGNLFLALSLGLTPRFSQINNLF